MKKSMLRLLFFSFFVVLSCPLFSQSKIDSLLPVRGFAIAAPSPNELDAFIEFINTELVPRKVNTLILRVDFNFEFVSHPELRDGAALSLQQVKQLVAVARKNKIRIIPQINLLGHQSWAGHTGKLLEVYPDFDETPQVKLPASYVWPNADNLYCKSYCPLHPGVHDIVFDLVDEICDAFESDAFHAGMDEVFYIGEDKCPRCGGRDKAELFAGELRKINDHLAAKQRALWIWGDRLLDGKQTGLGMWEASFNNTHRAIDMIPKEVVICDWHYDRAEQTAVYFAMKGFRVITCSWRKPNVALVQVSDMIHFRQQSSEIMKPRFLGVMETVWSSVDPFLKGYYGKKDSSSADINTPWNCFRVMFDEIKKQTD